jgi:hypothetical protein
VIGRSVFVALLVACCCRLSIIGLPAEAEGVPRPSDEWRLSVGYNCSAEIAAAADSREGVEVLLDEV